MKKIIILVFLLILQLSAINFINATNGDGGINLTITNNSISIGDFVYLYGTVIPNSNLILDSSTFNFGNYIICPTTINGIDNQTYQTNCYSNLSFSIGLPLKQGFLNASNNCTDFNYNIIESAEFYNYTQCLIEKATIRGNYLTLSDEYDKMNKSDVLYTKCNADFSVCQSEKTTLQTTIDSLNKAKDDTKNSTYINIGIGIAIGIVAMGFYSGKWGGAKPRNPDGNYNRTQAT